MEKQSMTREDAGDLAMCVVSAWRQKKVSKERMVELFCALKNVEEPGVIKPEVSTWKSEVRL